MPAHLYHNAVANALKGNIKVGTNALKAALVMSTHASAITTANVWADISAGESSGSGYTAGGVALSSPTLTVTEANSWGTGWAASTAYKVGDVVRPAAGNGWLYRAETAGTSAASTPTFPTVLGATVVDGGVTWTAVGAAIVQFTASAVTYPNVTLADFEFVEFYDSVTGYLIAEHDLGSKQTVSAASVTYTPDSLGVAWFFIN